MCVYGAHGKVDFQQEAQMMMQIWEYRDATGVTRRGVPMKQISFGGTDVSTYFHRVDDENRLIKFDNGGIRLDIINGPNNRPRHLGAFDVGEIVIPSTPKDQDADTAPTTLP
jgi:hypothetical protein